MELNTVGFANQKRLMGELDAKDASILGKVMKIPENMIKSCLPI